MKIIVEGKGIDYFTPNEVIIRFNFKKISKEYDKVLGEGTKEVETFIDNILVKLGFVKEDLKTKNFVIREETKYNELTRKYEFDGYSYNQNAILKFDYNMNLVVEIMNLISKLDNPPSYQINFGLKDERKIRKQLLSLAYKDALEQAIAISEAAGKKIKECISTSFKSNNYEYLSSSNLNNEMLYSKSMDGGISNISNVFTPEDIEINEVLYCEWITE